MSLDGEERTRFLATGELDIPDDDEWLVRLRHFRSTGRTIGRVRVLTRPLTDYLRCEMAFYAYSVKAGEDIRVLDLTDRENPGVPLRDFRMLDDNVVDMRYTPDGRQTGRHLLENPDLERYRDIRRLAVAHSVPYARYRLENELR